MANMTIFNVKEETISQFKEFCHNRSGGHFNGGFELLLERAKTLDILEKVAGDLRATVIEDIKDLALRVTMLERNIEQDKDNKEKDGEIKTFRGVIK